MSCIEIREKVINLVIDFAINHIKFKTCKKSYIKAFLNMILTIPNNAHSFALINENKKNYERHVLKLYKSTPREFLNDALKLYNIYDVYVLCLTISSSNEYYGLDKYKIKQFIPLLESYSKLLEIKFMSNEDPDDLTIHNDLIQEINNIKDENTKLKASISTLIK